MCLVIEPEPFVIVAVGVPELAFTVCFVSQPLAFILVSILEYLDPVAFPLAILVQVASEQASPILGKSNLLDVFEALRFDHSLQVGSIFAILFER